MNVYNGQLVENEDFLISFVSNGSAQQASVSCSCGVRVNLPRAGERYSCSNYYKHIKTTGCLMMKRKRTAEEDVNRPSNTIDNSEPVNEEQSQGDSTILRIPSSNSSITISATTRIDKPVKRSKISSEQNTSKRRRIAE
jgi:hypothetical protein